MEGSSDPADAALLELVGKAVGEEVPAQFQALALSQGIEAWLRAVFACNQYIDAQAPWTLKKTNPERMGAVLATLVRAIIDLAIAIQPVIPGSTAKLLDLLGVPEGERSYAALADGDRYARLTATGARIEAPSPIFPRLDMPGEG